MIGQVSWQAPPLPEDMVVATPERVSFSYETAGLGSRFVAQVIDLLVLTALLIGVALVALLVWVGTQWATIAALIVLVVGFAVFLGYFGVSEALWSGQTLGKRALGLRTVDAMGAPITAGQAVIRNLIRIVDFLPVYYGLGAVIIFVSRRNQRLGDLAAGTVVVRERQAISLAQLTAATVTPPPATAAPAAAAPRWDRRLEPHLRRFVVAYAGRRHLLEPVRRAELAMQLEPALRAAVPELVARHGALAALEQLADEVTPLGAS